MDYKLEAYGNKDSRRIISNNKVVALIEAYTDGTWGAFDINGSRLTEIPLANTARKAFNRWLERH